MTVNQSVWKVNEFKGEVFSSLVGRKKRGINQDFV